MVYASALRTCRNFDVFGFWLGFSGTRWAGPKFGQSLKKWPKTDYERSLKYFEEAKNCSPTKKFSNYAQTMIK